MMTKKLIEKWRIPIFTTWIEEEKNMWKISQSASDVASDESSQ